MNMFPTVWMKPLTISPFMATRYLLHTIKKWACFTIMEHHFRNSPPLGTLPETDILQAEISEILFMPIRSPGTPIRDPLPMEFISETQKHLPSFLLILKPLPPRKMYFSGKILRC